MRICLISNQIATWGKIGGFGTATRALGQGLARKGLEVHAVVPRRQKHGQGRSENLDGIIVHGMSTAETLFSGKIFQQIDANIYHSQEPTIPSHFAQKLMPERIHVITCRDPRGFKDHLTEFRHASFRRRLVTPVQLFYEASSGVRAAVRNADAVLSPAPSALHEKIKRLYGKGVDPQFVPYPIEIPENPPKKASKPTVLFVGRFDRRKRIEIFFELASRLPNIDFIAVGKAHEESYDRFLKKRWGHLKNMTMTGFVSRFDNPLLSSYYERAWVLVNTSAREGLPYTFLEAAGYGVSVLSCLNPESFASKYGYFVTDGDFESGLHYLLEKDRWREAGERAMKFVQSTWKEEECIDRHLELYKSLLRRNK